VLGSELTQPRDAGDAANDPVALGVLKLPQAIERELLGDLMVRRGATLARGDERLEAAADVAEVAEVAVCPGDPPASGGLRRVSFPPSTLRAARSRRAR
jgi:hypothetical protein